MPPAVESIYNIVWSINVGALALAILLSIIVIIQLLLGKFPPGLNFDKLRLKLKLQLIWLAYIIIFLISVIGWLLTIIVGNWGWLFAIAMATLMFYGSFIKFKI